VRRTNSGLLWQKGSRVFYTTLFVSIILFSVLAYTYVTPRPIPHFIQFSVVGPGGAAAGYFPATVKAGAVMDWTIGIVNEADSVQFIRIVAKLSNGSVVSPNSQNGTPGGGTILAEYERVVLRESKWDIPFDWEILAVGTKGASTILTMQVGGGGLPRTVANLTAVGGQNFRIVLELWTYNLQRHSFGFGWNDDGVTRFAWLQLWFNSTAIS
jgi:hypothetical protein